METKTRLERDDLLRDSEVLDRLRRNVGHENERTVVVVESVVNLVRTHGYLMEALADMLAPYDLTLAKYNLLMLLRNAPDGRLRMNEIGDQMSVSCANITKLVDGLEREGYVRRADLPCDRRVVLAELTDEGRALLRTVMPRHYANVTGLGVGLTDDECLTLTHLLLKLRAGIDSYNTKKQGDIPE